jgi:hypothetical protein
MTLLLITLVILWWIAVWGLFDMIILHLSRGQKMAMYGILILVIALLLQMNPQLLKHF